ncbi:MAG: hypothetical protein VKK42_13465 [Lyngbya sp.]|nr:hypothetical protein [Lyngbya sp.]
MSLIYLQLGEPIVFAATPEHKKQAQLTIGELATQLRTDCQWKPIPGHHCERCSYTGYF